MKPILFNTEMVKAILDGRKTETRRVAFPNKDLRKFPRPDNPDAWWFRGRAYTDWNSAMRSPQGVLSLCKYKEGDILYVRETWYKDICRYMFKANYSDTEKFFRDGKEVQIKWRPSIHMPKEAARLFLRVTDVRVERLQEITEEQALSEGALGLKCEHENSGAYGCTDYMNTGWLEPPKMDFMCIWNSTIKKKDIEEYGWDANPWVWVIEFKRCEKPKEDEA